MKPTVFAGAVVQRLVAGALLAALLVAPPVLAQKADRVEAAIAAGDRAFAARDYAGAITIFDRALKSAPRSDRADLLALRIANAAMAAGDPKAALAALTPYLERLVARGETADMALELAVDAAGRLNRDEEAIGYSGRLVDLRERRSGPGDPNVAAARLTLSIMQDAAGRHDAATATREAVLARLKPGDDRMAVLKMLNDAAIILQNRGQPERAEPLFARLIREIEPDGESAILGMLYFNVAALRFDQRRFDEAVAANRRSVDILEKAVGRDDPRSITAIAGLGKIYGHAGQPAAAVGLLKEAYDRGMARGGLDADAAILANNLADVLRALGRFEEARALDAANLDWRRKAFGPGNLETEISEINLALDLAGLKRADEGRALMQALVRRRAKSFGENHPATREARRRLAAMELAADAPGEAAKSFATIPADLSPTEENVRLVNLASGVAEKRGDAREADRLNRLALKLSETALGPLDPTTIAMLTNVARSDREARRPEAVAAYAELERRLGLWSRREIAATRDARTLEDVGRATRTSIGDIVGFSITGLGKGPIPPLLGRVLLNWKSAETSERALLDRIADDAENPATAELARKVKALREASRGAKPGPDAERDRQSLALSEAELAAKAGAYRRVAGETGGDYAEISRALGPDEAVVDYVAFSVKEKDGEPNVTRLAAMVTRSGERVFVKDFGRLDAIAALVPAAPAEEAGDTWRRDLHDRLIKPLARTLDGVGRLYVVPDDALLLVPFDGLVDGEGRNLIETRDVRTLRNARGVLAAKQAGGAGLRGPALAVGGVDYGPKPQGRPEIPPLPATKAEVDRLKAIAEGAKAEVTLVEGPAKRRCAPRSRARRSCILRPTGSTLPTTGPRPTRCGARA
ncbi:tetratricopeptide repeat protein [Methylopila sp. M107]|uniref:tetratricopeptide repeat protein n=1 Tax=Methylopila sp. M107 TaxID=1101190 RepID=UPI000361EBFA|nr:tetratricopeptide repeat protein [Methylopila sp. M107]